MKQLKRFCYALAASALMALLGGGAASATELYAGGTTLPSGTTIGITQSPSASSLFTGTGSNTFFGTCPVTSMEGTTENASGAAIAVDLNSYVLSGCSWTTDGIAAGSLSITHIPGTDNGTVTGSGSLLTSFTTVTCRYGYGEGTHIGTLVGKTNINEHATIAVNTIINEQTPKSLICPDSLRWTTSFVVTAPTGLNVREN